MMLHKDIQTLEANAVNLHICGNTVAAKKAYQSLIDTGTLNPVVYANQATILLQENRFDLALSLLKQATELKPDYAEAHIKAAALLDMLNNGKLHDAVEHLRTAININPENANAHYILGNVLFRQHEVESAIISFQNSLELNPNHAVGHYNLAIAYLKSGLPNEAAEHFRQATTLDTSLRDAFSKYWNICLKKCDWSDYDQLIGALRNSIRDQQQSNQIPAVANSISPFLILSVLDDPALHLSLSKDYAFAKTIANKTLRLAEAPLYRKHKRAACETIRIAFVSGDFRDHPLGLLIAELFELINQEKFEIHAVSLSAPNDRSMVRRRIKSACQHFHEADKLSNRDTAQLITDLNIDIAIDCHGFTSDCQPEIFAWRPAPIQVNQLGYPGTMGAEFIDYIIADPFLIPENKQNCYSEKIAYMPDTIQMNDRKRSIATNKPSRSDCGLPDSGFVFCCFNNSYKITPQVFTIWMELLKETPDSVLWLYESNPWMKSNLQVSAEASGVESTRLIFAEKKPYDEYLARIQQADLFVDTLPYNAHSTANDALWVGLPLVTCAGNSFAARVAGSNLRAAGTKELITYDLDAYKSLALDLAHNPEKLQQVRNQLISHRDTCPLFDTKNLVRNFEKAYEHMFKLYQADQSPETFYVSHIVQADD